MKPIINFLEKYSQWLAVGVASLFLLWVLFSYVLTAPVDVQVGSETYTPGDVDREVKKTVVDRVTNEIENTTPAKPPETSGSNVEPWVKAITGTEPNPPMIAANWVSSQVVSLGKIQEKEEKEFGTALVKALPKLPPAVPADEPRVQRAFVAPPAVAGADPAAAPAAGTDVNYVLFQYKISHAKLAEAFAVEGSKIDDSFKTTVVGIKLMRREVLPTGGFSDPVEVKPFGNAKAPLVPPAGAGQAAINAFRAWTETPQGQADLVQPAFYAILSGQSPWEAPEADAVVDPEAAERDRIAELRRQFEQRAREKAEGRRPTGQPRPPTERGRRPDGGRRGGSEFVAADPFRPADLSSLAGLELAQMFDDAGASGMPPPPPGMGGEAEGAPPIDSGNGIPPPLFHPRMLQSDVYGWAFDENVVEGKSYSYQVVYVIRNPVYEAVKGVIDPKAIHLAKQFAIESPLVEDNWSAPVKIPLSTEFFLAGPNWQGNNMPSNIRIEVYKNGGGGWHKDVFSVAPGDLIGSGERLYDFNTGAILVDIRFDPRSYRAYALILGPDNSLNDYDPLEARNSQRRAQLENKVKATMNVDPNRPGGVGGSGGGFDPGFRQDPEGLAR